MRVVGPGASYGEGLFFDGLWHFCKKLGVPTLVTTQRAHPHNRDKHSELESVMTAERTLVRAVRHSVLLAFHGFFAGFNGALEAGCVCRHFLVLRLNYRTDL